MRAGRRSHARVAVAGRGAATAAAARIHPQLAQQLKVGGGVGLVGGAAAAAAVRPGLRLAAAAAAGLQGTLAQRHMAHARQAVQLALQRAVETDVLQVPAAHGAQAGADGALGGAQLRPAAEEDDLGAVDGVACGAWEGRWGRCVCGGVGG